MGEGRCFFFPEVTTTGGQRKRLGSGGLMVILKGWWRLLMLELKELQSWFSRQRGNKKNKNKRPIFRAINPYRRAAWKSRPGLALLPPKSRSGFPARFCQRFQKAPASGTGARGAFGSRSRSLRWRGSSAFTPPAQRLSGARADQATPRPSLVASSKKPLLMTSSNALSFHTLNDKRGACC